MAAVESVPEFKINLPWESYASAFNPHNESLVPHLAASSILKGENAIKLWKANGAGVYQPWCESQETFPVTKLMWGSQKGEERLAATSIKLKIFQATDEGLKCLHQLARPSSTLAPLTSFDWNPVNPDKIGVSSIDTTCTIWNLQKLKIETQLIAHDKAVHDISFTHHETQFASAGADGSVRLFDQRKLEHSTIIYETGDSKIPFTPLVRLAWNNRSTNHIATLALDKPGVILIDIRRPGYALGKAMPDTCVNSIAWHGSRKDSLLCGTDDGNCAVWDCAQNVPHGVNGADEAFDKKGELKEKPGPAKPHLARRCDGAVHQVGWVGEDRATVGTARSFELCRLN